jgi:hypothetical protein
LRQACINPLASYHSYSKLATVPLVWNGKELQIISRHGYIKGVSTPQTFNDTWNVEGDILTHVLILHKTGVLFRLLWPTRAVSHDIRETNGLVGETLSILALDSLEMGRSVELASQVYADRHAVDARTNCILKWSIHANTTGYQTPKDNVRLASDLAKRLCTR